MSEATLRDHAIQQLVLANRILAHENVIDGFGHVSVRHPTKPDRFLLSRSRSPEVVTRDDIMEFALDGTLVSDDPRRPYAERFIHGAVYEARSDVMSVSHHHAPAVIPFSLTDIALRPAFHMASVIGAHVPVWDSQPEFGDTNMIVDTLEMGRSLAKTLGNGRTALLRGHGAICAAPDLRAICMVSIFMKDNAELVLNTLPLGQPKYLTGGEIDKAGAMLLGDMPLARAWDYWTARAGFPGI
ncbi:class II aldolase/adducin family protein [Hoeflea ulvae]|uniref:Class II aldolase/adducin family protein n=1 Tax=Hoeflea ulvae TaxID=2983764 RepID=A0ABT3YLZ7_9HYPH|nr:class II aldolase/adducin family protein [Hoeflea ulvae]MCY0096920.1 class II aldolase/adducin family protein [Hoeflea ulvae]